MFRKRFLCLLVALCCLVGVAASAAAAEVDSDSVYCFSGEDFSTSEDALTGICITGLPAAETGTVMLGTRVLRCGDILTAGQVEAMTFVPVRSEEDRDAVVTYLPIYADRVESAATMTIAIRGRQDQAPVAQDSTMETYKNLANTGTLKVTDPEGQTLTYTIVRQPKRGTVTVEADGSFTYTPKKNKVGTDSFTFTATDPAGNVSREATVTIQILKPTDSKQYSDTVGRDCRFTAEWMKNTGIFVGEQIGDDCCFQPDKAVTRGEFLAMAAKVLNIPVEEDAAYTGYTDEIPNWLQPYLAAALRSGMTAGLPNSETGEFGADTAITGAEAAVMLQNALDLTVLTQAEPVVEISKETGSFEEPVEEAEDAWAQTALAVMAQNGIELASSETLTRAEVANILYQVSILAKDAPGTAVYQ